jgi:transcriptional regulator with XRE-family HTH domain
VWPVPTVAEVVTKLREQQGLSQRELADRADVDHSYLARFERGQATPSHRWLRDVAAALGANLQALEVRR